MIKEAKVAIGLAILLALVAFIASFIWFNIPRVSIIVSFAIFGATLGSVAFAVFLPWIFSRMQIDPAVASGPFATIISDVLSVSVYMLTAQVFLKMI